MNLRRKLGFSFVWEGLAFGAEYDYFIAMNAEKILLNKELLALLACPKCGGELELILEQSGLACAACHLIYPIRDNIPVLLVEDAAPFA